MNDRHPPPADPAPGQSVRCEDCGTLRADLEPGWVQVAYPVRDRRREADGEVLLYYCPVHGANFDLLHPGVAAAFGG